MGAGDAVTTSDASSTRNGYTLLGARAMRAADVNTFPPVEAGLLGEKLP